MRTPLPPGDVPATGRAEPAPEAPWPRGDSELAGRIRTFDWASTPLGPLQRWPQSLRTLVDLLIASPVAAHIAWGPALTSIYNDAYARMLGARHPPALGAPLQALVPEIRAQLQPLVQATLAGEPQYRENLPLTPDGGPDGPRRWFTFSMTPVHDEAGRIAGFFSAAMETTEKVIARERERRTQDRALQARERQYQTLFESIDEGFCVIRLLFDDADRPLDYRFEEVNPAFERLTGLQGAAGRTARELAPDLEQKWFDIYGAVARTGIPTRFTEYAASMRRWFDVYAFRIGPPPERRVALLFNDITERREAEERQQAIFEIQTVGVMFWGRGFGLTAMNDAFLRMTGFSREEALGKTWQELTPLEFHPASWNAVHEVTTRGETTPYEKQYFRKDGSRWWGLFAARRIGDEVVEFVLDVTQRREAEAALREADQRKDVFLATLAHELRNPLAPLCNGLQIARLGLAGDDPPLRRTIEMMERQLSHLVRLVDDLLDVGRINAGKLKLERQPVQLAHVLAASIESTRSIIERHGHRLETRAPELPLHVEGDFDRLAQVFINLLTNAAKYTPGGGLIRLGLSRQGDEAVIDVADSGIGIPPGETERVFDLFSQVREHQPRAQGGLGIGLALVRSLVASHGGDVQAFSEGLGRGSRFTVRLPLLREPEAPAPRPRHPSSETEVRRRRIVVADDNADAATSLAELLRMHGHVVWTASGGVEAVQLAGQVAPEVVILDLGMPDLDGFEAARRIRALDAGAQVRLVALSGWGQDADRARTREAGFDHHLTKPAELEVIEEIVLRGPAG